MVQAAIVYVLVALAAAWIGWIVVLPKRLRVSLKARVLGRKATAGGGGCGCGKEGGC